MKKEDIVNFLKKNKVSLIIGSIVVAGGYWFTHTNFSYHLEDHTGKYILNPEYKEFHKYQLTDLKSVYPTKLAYDPKWFILPPDKYIPKEQPVPKEISNISDPIIRRQAYFNFLCKNEYTAYMTSDIRNKGIEQYKSTSDGVLDLNATMFIPKVSNSNSSNINYENNSNPFILPIYSQGYVKIKDTDILNFFFYKQNDNKKFKYNENQFKEIMVLDGTIYQIRFNKETSTFLPLKKVDKSQSRYYILTQYVDREYLKNLGISEHKEIIYDRKENKIVFYIQQFNMGAILPWKETNAISNFSWAKQSGCDFKPQYIDKF